MRRCGATPAATAGATAPPAVLRPLLAAILTASLAVLLGSPASAQSVGDPVEAFLDATGAAATATDGAYAVGATTVRPEAWDGILAGVTVEATLDDEGIADAAGTLAIATGYGANIEEPLQAFLGGRAGELADAGPVTVGLEAFALHVDVRGEAQHEATLTLEYPRVDEEAFGPPVASLGPEDADVVVREFSDFQCPYCRRYAQEVLPGLKEGLLATGQVRFDYHHFPLVSLHANAEPAAEAAQCVADAYGPDAFWAYHDRLFERQAAWQGLGDAEPYFARLAGDVDAAALAASGDGVGEAGDDAGAASLDAEATVAACLDSGASAATVDAAIERARALRLSGTPSVFVGGYRLNDFGDPAAYAQLIRLARAGDEATD